MRIFAVFTHENGARTARVQGTESSHGGRGRLSIMLRFNRIGNYDFPAGISDHLTQIDVFPAVKTIGGIEAADSSVQLCRDGRVSIPIVPTLGFGCAQSRFLKLCIAVGSVHLRVSGLGENIVQGADHPVIVAV